MRASQRCVCDGWTLVRRTMRALHVSHTLACCVLESLAAPGAGGDYIRGRAQHDSGTLHARISQVGRGGVGREWEEVVGKEARLWM